MLWVGTQAGGLNRLSRPGVTAYPVGTGAAQGEVLGLAECPAGEYWAATWGGGLHRGPLGDMALEAGVPELQRFPFLRTVLSLDHGGLGVSGADLIGRRDAQGGDFNVTMLVDAGVTAVCEDADSSLLFGGKTGVLQRLRAGTVEPVPSGNFTSPFMAMAKGKQPGVWVATHGAGLFHWDQGKLERWTTAEGLPTNLLRALHEDAAGTLWIGTSGGGLAWLKDGRIHSVDSSKGLVNDSICPILEDAEGNLWLGSIHGISRVSKGELFDVAAGRSGAVHPLALDESDGMPASECTAAHSPAGLRSASGLLLFSTTRHIVAVDPKQFPATAGTPPPEVRIEAVVADRRSMDPKAAELAFPPGVQEMTFEFTAFNYLKPDRIRFRHRLKEADGEWTTPSRQRSARFSLLPPGDYTFEVNAANEDGRWHETGASLAFTVQPFYWQTVWFRTLAVLLVMAGSGGMVWKVARGRIRHAQERERLARAEAETLERRHEVAHLTRVAMLGELSSALAHELNQPLGAILRNAEAGELFMADPAPDLDEIRAILVDIRKDNQRAGSVIDRMRGLLKRHALETGTLSVAELTGEVAGLLRADAARRNVTLEIKVPDDLPPVLGDRVHLQQVLLNLVINALDALADAALEIRCVSVHARLDASKMIEVSVSDTGPGISPGGLAKIFDPFFTTKANGMGMGLAISRTIIKAHGGELWAENNDGPGATFRFTLPAARDNAGT